MGSKAYDTQHEAFVRKFVSCIEYIMMSYTDINKSTKIKALDLLCTSHVA